MTAIPMSNAATAVRRRGPNLHWPPLSFQLVQILAAVNELGPETHGKALADECKTRLRQKAACTWRGRLLPRFMLTWGMYRPINRATVYGHLSRLKDYGYVNYITVPLPHEEHIMRLLYSMTPVGKIRLNYELSRLTEAEQKLRLFRQMAD